MSYSRPVHVRSYDRWTPREEALLREHALSMTGAELQRTHLPNKSPRQIREKRIRMGLTKESTGQTYYWTPEEEEILSRYNLPAEIDKILPLLPGRTESSIRSKIYREGQYQITRPIIWTDQEITILKEQYARLPTQQIERLIPGKTREQIQRKATTLGLPSPYAINILERSMSQRNTSGHKGVCFIKHTGNWRAYLSYDHQTYYCGEYETKEKAIEAREQIEAYLRRLYLEKCNDLHFSLMAEADRMRKDARRKRMATAKKRKKEMP